MQKVGKFDGVYFGISVGGKGDNGPVNFRNRIKNFLGYNPN